MKYRKRSFCKRGPDLARALHLAARDMIETMLDELQHPHVVKQLLQSLLEGSKSAITLRDVNDQRFIDCNTAALRLYGCRSREDLAGTRPQDLAPERQPDGTLTADATRHHVQRALADGWHRFEWTARRLNGELFPAELRISVIEVEGRRVMQTMIDDISERREAELALRRRASRDDVVSRIARRLVRGEIDGAIDAAVETLGKELGADRARVRVFADGGATVKTIHAWYADAAVPALPASEALSPDQRTWLMDQLSRAEPIVMPRPEGIFRVDDGESDPAATLVLPLMAHRTITGWLAFETLRAPRTWGEEDVAYAARVAEIIALGHARAEAEAALRESESRYRNLVEVSHDAIVTLDLSGRILFANPALIAMFGYTREEILGDPELVWRAAVPETRDMLKTRLEALAQGIEIPTNASGAYLDKNGRAVHVESTGAVIRDASGKAVGMHLIVRDVTDRIRAEEMQRNFLANMSHELRTPLNGVIGMVDLLARSQLDEGQRRHVEVARSSAGLLLSVINDILDFSKIEAGKLELDAQPFTMGAAVDQVAAILAPKAEEKGLELSRETSSALARTVVGDGDRVKQVLLNLLNNAIKFTARGRVTIRASAVTESERELRARVEVEDTGVGIAESARGALFKPFSQADASTTRKYGGTGLGLAICREIVERMGGEIGFTSAPGVGSTFWFEVPFPKAAMGESEGPVPSSRSPLRGAEGAGAKVLLVEDSVINAEVAAAILRSGGHSFRIVEDGEAAVDAVRGEPFDLVLMDCQLPVLDGYEATRRIRQLEAQGLVPGGAGGRVPIVALTATATKADLERCLAAGMDTYLTKPIDARRLLEVVASQKRREPPRRVDLTRALLRMQGNRELLARIAAQFPGVAREADAGLRSALANRDVSGAAFLVHRLRGQAATFDAERLLAALAELDDAVRTERWPRADTALAGVQAEMEALAAVLANVEPH